MGRIRTVKPEFFRHEGLQDLEIENPGAYPMFVFQGLWLQCDRNGVFEWRPRQLKLDILPFLPFDMLVTLGILERAKYVLRYSVDGKEYGQIPSFSKHQRLSGKEATQEGERFPLPNSAINESMVKQAGSTGEAVGKNREASGNDQLFTNVQEKEREKEKERERNISSPSGDSSPSPGESVSTGEKTEDGNLESGIPENEDVILDENKNPKPCPHQTIIDTYHSCCPSLPRVESWNDASRKVLAARWREKRERQEIEWWERYFRRVNLSDFLTGRVKDFVANLNWLIGPKNMEKVLNGAYDNRASPVPERLRNNLLAGAEFLEG